MKQYKTKILRSFIILSLVVAGMMGAFYIYTSNFYRADAQSIAEITSSAQYSVDGGAMVLRPAKPKDVGFIFYPGGKVEPAAYLPLLYRLSEQGITCIVVKMPFHLAVFDSNAADRIYTRFPEINSWYLGGHSLGGAMASSYFSNNPNKLKGIVLLGAYIYGDVDPDTALTLYGSEDLVLNRDKINYSQNVHVIDGGNHAQFGNYGMQKGDGIATITGQEQQQIAVEYITAFMDQGQDSAG